MITMGVDLGIKKVAWSIWEDDILLETCAFESDKTHRIMQIRECSRHVYHNAMRLEPDSIWIEDVLVGNNRKYSLNLAMQLGALSAELWPFYSKVFLVNNKTWKKEVVGTGRANKEMVQKYIWDWNSAYAVLCGNDQDRFDAACIGYYGYVIAQRAGALADSG